MFAVDGRQFKIPGFGVGHLSGVRVLARVTQSDGKGEYKSYRGLQALVLRSEARWYNKIRTRCGSKRKEKTTALCLGVVTKHADAMATAALGRIPLPAFMHHAFMADSLLF